MSLDRALSADGSANARKTLRCQRCGYEAIIAGRLPRCPMCQEAAWHELESAPAFSEPASEIRTAQPTWEMVERVLAELSSTQRSFTGIGGRTYRLERYHRDWRVRAVVEDSSRWVEVEDIRACWETFERLGRIRREDVLDPGRCSSFMMAIFKQVPGIEQTDRHNPSLAFA